MNSIWSDQGLNCMKYASCSILAGACMHAFGTLVGQPSLLDWNSPWNGRWLSAKILGIVARWHDDQYCVWLLYRHMQATLQYAA